MSKTLLVQVSVGNTYGYIYNQEAKKAAEIYNNICMPSVQKYCEKYNYDYKLVTDYPYEMDIHYFNKNTKAIDYDYSTGGKNKCSTLIRYLNMDDSNYDNIVSLDNDIWIPDWAEPIPKIDGHHGAVDLGKPWAEFKAAFNVPFGKFINGGVQMVNKVAGKSLHDFVVDKINHKVQPMIHTDQAYMNEWRSYNMPLSYTLDKKWNFMVGCYPRTSDYSKYNFIHYAGANGREIILDDYKNGLFK